MRALDIVYDLIELVNSLFALLRLKGTTIDCSRHCHLIVLLTQLKIRIKVKDDGHFALVTHIQLA
jgi:hypothetical protein